MALVLARQYTSALLFKLDGARFQTGTMPGWVT